MEDQQKKSGLVFEISQSKGGENQKSPNAEKVVGSSSPSGSGVNFETSSDGGFKQDLGGEGKRKRQYNRRSTKAEREAEEARQKREDQILANMIGGVQMVLPVVGKMKGLDLEDKANLEKVVLSATEYSALEVGYRPLAKKMSHREPNPWVSFTLATLAVVGLKAAKM